MIRLGLQHAIFRGTAGSTASTLMKNVKDVTFNLEGGEADITTRATKGWRAYAETLKDGSIDFNMLYDDDDADLKAVQLAFLNHTPIAVFVSDGLGNGFDFDAIVTNFSWNQSLEEASDVSVTLRPTLVGGSLSRAPQWIENGPTPEDSSTI